MARKWLPANVTEWKDRHGKRRYRFRKAGLPVYHFRNPPGTEGFREEYQRALQAVPAPPLPRFAPHTYDALIASFYTTPGWLQMADSSQKTYRGIIERFRAKNGSKDIRRVTTASIDNLLAKRADTPAAANNLRKALARLHRHAIKLGWRTDNPVTASDSFSTDSEGFHTWTETEIAQFEQRWPIGTRERLAMALLLYTALRRSDMVKLGRQHRQGDRFKLYHGKNKSETDIPIVTDLAAALDALDGSHLTYLVTEFGKPFTANGFGNWFRKRCDLAGLPQCSAHGLRKAMSRRLAESGATALEGRAVTGHKTIRHFAAYAEKADNATLTDRAMANLERKFAKKGE